MTRLRGLLICFLVAAVGGPATACMNDEESPIHEREFRSQYGEWAGLPSGDEIAHHYRGRHELLMGGGAALLAGAAVLAAKRPRSRA